MNRAHHEPRPADAPGTGRVETFSDGVFAIVITLLVLDLRLPEHPAGALLHELLAQWPAYLAFTVSFVYIGIIWLNHHALFRRIRRTAVGLNWANLGVLFGAVILPFPTAVLAAAFGESGDRADQRVAVTFCAPPSSPWRSRRRSGWSASSTMIVYHAITSEGLHEGPLGRLRR
jgi:uncharacterized membrane protein